MKQKPQRGTIYKTDGRVILVKPKNLKEFELHELQAAVGGYIEIVRPLNLRTKLYFNEEGLLKNLPINPHAQTIVDANNYAGWAARGISYVGDAISTYRLNPGEEHDETRSFVSEVL